MKPPELLKIGLPSNGQMKIDCFPVRELLELDANSDGTYTSAKVSGTLFFPLRVNTVAQKLRDQILDFGIIGDDTAINANLELPIGAGGSVKLFPRPSATTMPLKTADYLSSERKCFTLGKLPKTDLCLLRRNEDLKTPFPRQGSIATSYVEAARKLIISNREVAILNDPWSQIRFEEGQIEFMVRAMPTRYEAAVDVVRSGKTAEQYGLSIQSKLLESRPGVWRSLQTSQQMTDTQSALRECLWPLFFEEI